MGLLDGLLGSLMGGQQQAGGVNPLLQIAMQMLANKGNGGSLDMGGLAGIVDAFQKGGLGHLADSWVGTGQNLPVSADQLTQVLGSERIGQMASQLGLNQGDLLGQLSHMLPQVVDKLTPQGQVPQGDLASALGGGELGNLLGGLLQR